MKAIQVDNYVADYIEEAARDFVAFCGDGMDLAKAFYVNMTLSADIAKHLQPSLTKSELAEITKCPETLFAFATDFLKFTRKQEAEKGLVCEVVIPPTKTITEPETLKLSEIRNKTLQKPIETLPIRKWLKAQKRFSTLAPCG